MTHRESDVTRLAREYFYLAGAEVPVNLGQLCSRLNLRIKRLPFSDDSVAAFFSTAHRAIVVNSLAARGRVRFSIAHELGHYALGSSGGVPFFGNAGASERHANAFAAELLMPKPIVISICDELNLNVEPLIRWPDFLAFRLGVSREAARVRLKEMRLNRYG